MRTLTFEAIGTQWTIDLPAELSEDQFVHLKKDIDAAIEQFDQSYSRFRKDSLITQMAQKPDKYPLDSVGSAMLHFYQKVYDLTSGAFTPLIASVLEEAGYDSSYSLQSKPLHAPIPWEEALELHESSIQIKKPSLLDLGAAGKGALIDLVEKICRNHVLHEYCIDAGGDIFYRGEKPLRVGLEHPENPKQVLGVVELKNQSIAASAGNRRKWGTYHHIIDPRTLESPRDILATWVIADTAMIADGIATALFLVSPETLTGDFTFAYFILHSDYTFEKSEDFPSELYYN